jgi:hypothetical protein
MNTDKQRIAIAEACGWTVINDTLCHVTPDKDGLPQIAWIARLPDYLNDLNAMHKAETVLILDCEWATYLDRLSVIVAEGSLVHATAAQRAEAFLRTVGKWEGVE